MRLTRRPSHALVLTLALGLAALLGEGVWPSTAWGQEELFVANFSNNAITVYPRTASGATAPIRTLSGAATGLNGPDGLVVDTVNNELVVANFSNSSITVYSRTASGNFAFNFYVALLDEPDIKFDYDQQSYFHTPSP